MHKVSKLSGLGTAIVTPFLENRKIDFSALERIVEYNIAANVDFLVVLGTTGEAPCLSREEKLEVCNFVVEKNRGRKPLVLGLGGNNTAELTQQCHSIPSGFDYILSVVPFYNKPSQRGIIEHFKAVSEALGERSAAAGCGECQGETGAVQGGGGAAAKGDDGSNLGSDQSSPKIILYNIPSRCGVRIEAESVLQLAEECPNIVGIKEASGDLNLASCIIDGLKPLGLREKFSVFSGDDALCFPLMCLGADGLISTSANAYPKEFVRLIAAIQNQDLKMARELHYRLLPSIKLFFEEGNPSGVKAGLKNLGLCNQYLRLPLVEASESLCKKIEIESQKFVY